MMMVIVFMWPGQWARHFFFAPVGEVEQFFLNIIRTPDVVNMLERSVNI
jgi:hypothetical protein